MRDGGAYGCAVPRAYANLNPGLVLYTAPNLANLLKSLKLNAAVHVVVVVVSGMQLYIA